MLSRNLRTITIALGVAALPAVALAQNGQPRVSLEVRGGANVPTFDIADAAKTGPSFGGGLDLKLGSRFHLLAEGDFGFHKGADLPAGGSGPDVDVFHFIGKVGIDLLDEETTPWIFMVNAGAGALSFSVEGASTFTYPAINVGAKIGYRVSDHFAVIVSPQGDIAFSDAAELGTDNSWVWPFAAGFRVRF